MTLGLSTFVHTTFADAVARTPQALAEQGFGVLTEIDVKATLKSKLGVEMEDYLILGACNPALAHHALEVDRQIGLLLPCNVVVRTDTSADGCVLIEAVNPQMLVDVTGEPQLAGLAAEVSTKLHAALHTLAADPSLHTAPSK